MGDEEFDYSVYGAPVDTTTADTTSAGEGFDYSVYGTPVERPEGGPLTSIWSGLVSSSGAVLQGLGEAAAQTGGVLGIQPAVRTAIAQNHPLTRAGEAVESVAPDTGQFGETFMGHVFSGLGSSVPILAASAINPALGAAAGVGMGAEAGAESADAAGVSGQDRGVRVAAGAAIGTTEVIPIARLLQRLNKGTGNVLQRILKDAVMEGGEEAVQEFLQTVASGAADKTILGDEKAWGSVFTEAAYSAAVGGVAGALLGGTVRTSTETVRGLTQRLRTDTSGDGQAGDVTIDDLVKSLDEAIELTSQIKAELRGEAPAPTAPVAPPAALEEAATNTPPIQQADLLGQEGTPTAEVPAPEAIDPTQYANEGEYFSAVAEESSDPREIALAYQQASLAAPALSNKEQAIADHLSGTRLSASSYDQFGDPNKRGDDKQVGLSYLSADGQAIDQAAQEMSTAAGETVTPQDVVDFVNTYPGGVGQATGQESELATRLKDRFKEVTGGNLTDKRLAELTAPPAQPVAPTPTEIGIDNEITAQVRKDLALEEMPATQRQSWEELLTAAQTSGIDSAGVDQMAAEVARKPRTVTGEEQVALLVREAELESQYARYAEQAEAAIENLDAEAADRARAEMQRVRDQIEVNTRASKVAGTELARAMNARRMRFDRQALYSEAKLLVRAKIAKGQGLSRQEEAHLQKAAKKIAQIDKHIEKLESRGDGASRAADMKVAQQAVTEQAKTVKKATGEARTKVQQRREALLKQLAEAGFKVHDVGGLTVEAARIVGGLARTYIEEGVVRVPEIIRAVQGRVDINERDVIDVLAGRYAESRQRSQVAQNLAEVRSQANLIAKIDDALDGELAEKQERRAPSETVQDLRTTLNVLTEELVRGERDEARLAATLEKIDTLRDLIHRGIDLPKSKGRKPDPQAIADAKQQLRDLRSIARVEEQARDLEDQLATGRFKSTWRPPRREPPSELVKARARRARLQAEADAAVDALTPLSWREKAKGTLELPRNFLASGDVGALLRQGIFHAINPLNARTTAKSATAMMRALLSQDAADQIQQGIFNSPLHGRREKAGLAIKDLQHIRLSDRERVVRNSLIERKRMQYELAGKPVPKALDLLSRYMNASERNYVVALNVLRAELFDQMVQRHPSMSDQEAAAWANYINVTTGHGSLRFLDAVAGQNAGDTLNQLFFSGRLLGSRIQTPFTVINTALKHPAFRKQLAKDVGGMVLGAGTVYALASLIGDVEFDPEDSDFLKVQVGNTRFDFAGGYAQALRLSLGLLQSTDAAKEVGLGPESPFREDAAGLVGTFLKYKFAPSLGFGLMMWEGEDALGNDLAFDVPGVDGGGFERFTTRRANALLKSFTPIFGQEVWDAAKTEGADMALASLGLNLIGVGASTYDAPFKANDVENALKRIDYLPSPGRRPDDVDAPAWRDDFRRRMAGRLREAGTRDVTKSEAVEMAARVRREMEWERGLPEVPKTGTSDGRSYTIPEDEHARLVGRVRANFENRVARRNRHSDPAKHINTANPTDDDLEQMDRLYEGALRQERAALIKDGKITYDE